MESAIFTRTRDVDFACDLTSFPVPQPDTAELKFRNWFSVSGVIALSRPNGTRNGPTQLWLRTHDPDRKDRVGQRPILCIACVRTDVKHEIQSLESIFADAILNEDRFNELCDLVRQDAAVAEDSAIQSLPATKFAEFCASTDNYHRSADSDAATLQKTVAADNRDNRRRMAEMCRHQIRFRRLLIGKKPPTFDVLPGKTFLLLPEFEVERFRQTSEETSPSKKLVNQMKNLWIVCFVIAIGGLAVYAFQLHQRLDKFEQSEVLAVPETLQMIKSELAKIESSASENVSQRQLGEAKAAIESLAGFQKQLSNTHVEMRTQQERTSQIVDQRFKTISTVIEQRNASFNALEESFNALEEKVRKLEAADTIRSASKGQEVIELSSPNPNDQP